MKSILPITIGKPLQSRILLKQAAATQQQSQGTTRRPQPPREVIAQNGARRVLLNWSLPFDHQDITGWRIYKDTEDNLVLKIAEKDTRQAAIELTTTTTPPVTNYFVSSATNSEESAKVQVQAQAALSEDVPSDPSPPPEWNYTEPGGGNRGGDGGGRQRQIQE